MKRSLSLLFALLIAVAVTGCTYQHVLTIVNPSIPPSASERGTVTIPDVRRLTPFDALTKLTDAGFKIDASSNTGADVVTVTDWTVVGTQPAAGISARWIDGDAHRRQARKLIRKFGVHSRRGPMLSHPSASSPP